MFIEGGSKSNRNRFDVIDNYLNEISILTDKMRIPGDDLKKATKEKIIIENDL
jgi:hypothetical protein